MAGTLPEIHWWAARVPLNLVYPSSAGSTRASSPGGRPTDKSMCLRSIMCARTSLSSRAMCPNTEMQWAARILPMAWDLYVPARRHYWRSQTSEYLVSDADISCGRPLTPSCPLQEESKFLLHTTVQTKPKPDTLASRNLVVSLRGGSFQIPWREAITQEASPICRSRSWLQHPLEDCSADFQDW